MTKHSPSRETTGTDWPLVDEYFDTLLAAYEAGRIDRETFSKWLTHMIGAANNYGIEHVVLNQPQYRQAEILVAGDNFGCGSSREHAPWALLDFGIRCVISTSFADIFYNNCFKNGILPVVLPPEAVAVLMEDAKKGANARVTVDLPSQTVTTSDGQSFGFDIDPFKKHCLLNGLDDIGLSLEKVASIDAYEGRAAQSRPWI